MNTRNIIGTIALCLAITSCTSTKIVTEWRDPAVSIEQGSFNKVLHIALIKDEATRRAAEDKMVSLSNGHGMVSYNYLGNNVEALNNEGANDKLIADGIDGVVIMRLVDVAKEQTYVPGNTMPAYYASPYGYYGYAAPMYYDPGYVQTDVTYMVETNVYSTRQGKLIWTATTSTMNPADVTSAVGEIVTVIHNQMRDEGFMRPAPKN
ncbi:MAG: hypothetical protein KDC00_14635 [Flavobacteriales bacterium]|nr:hypothetical protein [Flavobacteriales bacterium]